jgi:hypothetical protein
MQHFAPVQSILLEPLLPDDPLLPLLPDDPLLPLDPLLPGDPPLPQNALRERPHATSELPHAPSTQAAARNELPLPQLQHEGLQSAYVEQVEPVLPVPRSRDGCVGQLPFTCSAFDETLLEPLEPLGSVGLEPVIGTPVVPAVHATRRRAAMLDEPTTKRRSPCAISHSKDRVRRDDGTEDARRNARGVPRRTPGNRRRSRVARGARPHA